MNPTNRVFAASLVLTAALWASGSEAGRGAEPANPLRGSALSLAQSTAGVQSGEAEPSERRVAERAAPIKSVSSGARSVRQAAHTHPVTQPTSISSVSEYTMGGGEYGEYIIEHSGKGGEILFDDFGGPDCCGGSGCGQCCLLPCPVLSLNNLQFSTGVHGFTGPKNRGQSGSFGFHGGFNWGAAFPCSAGSLGTQFGLNSVFSNFSGASFTPDDRRQLFLTGGLFRRVDWGLQGGLVIDYLSDDWYTDTDLVQVRGEASWMFPCTHELGFWFAAGTQEDTQLSALSGLNQPLTETWEPTNLYAFFYRHRFAMMDGATARFYAGFSGDSDGLIGGDLRLPINCDWALEAGFAYLVPEEASTGAPGGGHEHESWNIGLSLVWYPGARSAIGNDYYRPLFNVADNGSFMVMQ